jgi:hypothetical protein
MPYPLFHKSQYDAETTKWMTDVFEELCLELGLAPREDRLRDTVARAIIECAEQGQREPELVRQCARKAFLST